MQRLFRKYHRTLSIIAALPLLFTVLTGMGYTVMDEWFHNDDLGNLMMRIHTMRFLGLDKIYPLLTGLSLVGLLVTGITMTNLFRRSRA